ncbi:MAG: hypothetical protein QOE09_1876 [Ilumatobacteraceae bacterium]|jgi:uncharacterized membrane protein
MDDAGPDKSGGVRGEIEHILEASAKRLADGESAWGVRSAVIAAIALQVAIPNRYEIPPTWLLPSLGVLLGIALSIVHPRRITRHSPQIRLLSISLIAVISLGNAGSGGRLIAALLRGREQNPTTLLLTGGAIWLTNVIVFGMWYWELDRGGPAARFRALKPYPDFLFPQMTGPELSRPHWRPEFLDYLYLSFTNAAAFSPTDVLPLARWAKMAMMLQSIVSLSTIVLVIARAVNILK